MATESGRDKAVAKAEAAMRAFIAGHKERNGKPQFDFDVMRRAKLVDASMTGKIAYEIELGEEYSNSNGALHGAAIALLLDMYTSAAFTTLSPDPKSAGSGHIGGPPGGVSRAMNLAYLRPLMLPAAVQVHCEVVQHGRSASMAKGTIMSVDGTKLYATCEHHKIQLPESRHGLSKM